ncbi:HD domain-containing protein [Dolosigranulum savutiense]|uniref:HD domain-containing protein n=1 Tax=Dolosigranulum savutiense TaxID=3110288 RepID=A0AB74TH16_9LACT
MRQQLIDSTVQFVKEQLDGDSSGHDWFHIERVWTNALSIHEQEQTGNLLVIELAALLHDLADSKLFDEVVGRQNIHYFLEGEGVPDSIVQHVLQIIDTISFRKGIKPVTIEGQIVQDADRLDAIGAIGIARAFTYGGATGQALFDPTKPLDKITDQKSASTIHHFFDKLLVLQELMNTTTGRKLAKERYQFMLDFLDQFFSELDQTIDYSKTE